jgi:queuine tRNA-ribosyltransferase
MERVDPRAGLACEHPDFRDPAAHQSPGTFDVLAEVPGGAARAGRLWTRHGPVDTPCFMPVGTYGAVKGLTPDDLIAVGSQVILGNAYHLSHR